MIFFKKIKEINQRRLIFIFYLWLSGLVSACAYQMGSVQNQWLEGYEKMAIPVFENQTQYAGIEVYFTNFLIQEFEKSKITQLVSVHSSPVLMIGHIEEVKLKARGFIDISAYSPRSQLRLPKDTVLASNYDVYVKVSIKLLEKSNQKLIWKKSFSGEKSYHAPQISLRGLNSANSLYNHKARLTTIKEIAEKLMVEAHDSIVENF